MISIVTPTRNAAAVIERNLRSMQIQQADFEHIIQDCCSSDNTANAVKQFETTYKVHLISEADSGIYDGIARGFEKSSGEILGWLGADDYYFPWTLSTVQAVFDRYPSINWITGVPVHSFHDGKLVWCAALAPVYCRSLIAAGWQRPRRLGLLQQEPMFWRRSLYEDVSGAQIIRSFKFAGDFHLWKAFAARSHLRTVGCPLAAYSVSPRQASELNWAACMAEIHPDLTEEDRLPSWWGKIAARVLSIVLNGRILRPYHDFQ